MLVIDMSLLDDPVQWVEASVGSRGKFLFIITTQIVLGFTAIYFNGTGEYTSAMTSGILLFGIGFLCIYVYALRSLLAEYRKLSSHE